MQEFTIILGPNGRHAIRGTEREIRCFIAANLKRATGPGRKCRASAHRAARAALELDRQLRSN